jgi:hypothetical protein
MATAPVESEIDDIAFAVFVAVARSSASFAGRTKQLLAQELRICRRQSESGREYASFMPPACVSRIEAIVAKFGDVHGGPISARQFHIADPKGYLCAPGAIPKIWR